MPLNDRDYMRRSQQPSRGGYRGGGFNDWLTQNPVLALIGVNIVFFIATSLNKNLVQTPQGAPGLLALSPALLLGRPWTILTSLFTHANIYHILFNMLALYYFGRMLTTIVGPGRFLLIYFVGGILGNLLFLAMNYGTMSIVIGASGAVYAVAGALVVLVPKARISFWGVIPMPLWAYVLVFLVLLSLPPFVGVDIAWQAHMGGLAAGLVGGFLWRRTGKYYYFR